MPLKLRIATHCAELVDLKEFLIFRQLEWLKLLCDCYKLFAQTYEIQLEFVQLSPVILVHHLEWFHQRAVKNVLNLLRVILQHQVCLLYIYIFEIVVNTIDHWTDFFLCPKLDRFLAQMAHEASDVHLSVRTFIDDSIKILSAKEAILIFVEQMENEPKLVLVIHFQDTVDARVKFFVTH